MKKQYLILNLLMITNFSAGRSIHRELDIDIPTIITSQSDLPNKKYTLKNSHIREFSTFGAYNSRYLKGKLLPNSPIGYRFNKENHVSGKTLSNMIENFTKEVLSGKKEFTDFIVLKQKDFNSYYKCGLIVTKFKKYPFIAKIFFESAYTFTKPYSKGLFPMGMFVMGGSNRHITGFTRIKNAENIKTAIAKTKWKNKISVPRKWFWLPKKPTWINIEGYNIGNKKKFQKTKLPAIYAVIADEIIEDTSRKPTRKECIAICRDIDFVSDPHYNNFRSEANVPGKPEAITIMDTEHFPTLIGATKKIKPATHSLGWYIRITRKYLTDHFFSSKDYRRARQTDDPYYKLY